MTTDPELSIVVAASRSGRTIFDCLNVLALQVANRPIEVLVVAATDGDARVVSDHFPDFTLIEARQSCLIPELWGLGVSRSRGRVVVITVATCVPEAHWVDEIVRAHADSRAAIGGAIEIAADANLVDWAVYFVRYTPFMLPFLAGPAEVPGDNGSYKRAAIADQMEWIQVHGFWESEVNARLRAQMCTLSLDPRIIVYYKHGFSLGGFSRQRVDHGRIFGQTRAARCSRRRRLFYLLTSPVIPLLYLARITRNLLHKKRHFTPFVRSLPITIWFLCCWSMGELMGLARG